MKDLESAIERPHQKALGMHSISKPPTVRANQSTQTDTLENDRKKQAKRAHTAANSGRDVPNSPQQIANCIRLESPRGPIEARPKEQQHYSNQPKEVVAVKKQSVAAVDMNAPLGVEGTQSRKAGQQWSNQESVDDKLRWLYNIIQDGVTQFVPVYISKPSRFPPWFSSELTEKIILKKAAHTQYKKENTRRNYTLFSNLRQECKNLCNKYYNVYVDKVEGSLKGDTKAFWNYIKDKKRVNSDIPVSVVWDNQSASSGVEISNLFAQFFKSIYAPVSDDSVTLAHSHPYPQSVNLNDFEVTFDIVFKQLSSLDPSKAAGPDGLPNAFLKNCAIGLCEPLTHISQSPLQCGVFLTDWKLSYVSPIHKKGPKNTVTNYRPICIQSALAKLFEKLI
ncbi:uncharacterized protein LOC129252839 [Anastrepha obliqua]|uniref:uncharacterized protein LOC129252839 n=1 Tax=Anastrepha obliqua TaxID=95512 RepID=UPI0024091BEB|nr:uncharacterized protein LOC129252839 [Anastrepha obliqua]